MAAHALRRFYAPECMVPREQRLGELPGTRKAYATALRLAVPSMSEAFLMALVSMVDTLMVSGIGTEAIAAVALCNQPRFLIITAVMALNVAVTSIVARRRGENDPDSAGRTLRQSLVLSLSIALCMTGLAFVFRRPLLWAVGAQPETFDMALAYFETLLLGIPGSCVSMTICAAQRGAGATRVAMRVNIAANLVNVVFNYLLIGGKFGFPRLETRGAAIATVIGWTVGMLMAVFSVTHREGFLTVRTRQGWRFERGILQALFKVASGSFLEQICQRVGFLAYNVLVANLGTAMLAANTIGMNIINLSFSLGDGLSVGASALVGQNLGRRRPDLSLLYGKVCQRIACLACSVIFVLYTLFGRAIYSLFTSDPEILKISESIMIIISIVVIGQAIQLVYMGCLRGAGDTRYTAVVTMVSMMLLRPGLAWVLTYPCGMGLIGAWISFMCDQYLRLLLTYLRFKGGKWMSIKL